MTTDNTPATPPTPEDLRALAARVLEASEAATPGPWFWDEYTDYFLWTPQKTKGGVQMVCDAHDGGVRIRGTGARLPQKENAAFIAMSRTAAPELARAVLALLEEVASLKATFSEVSEAWCLECFTEEHGADSDDVDGVHIASCCICGKEL